MKDEADSLTPVNRAREPGKKSMKVQTPDKMLLFSHLTNNNNNKVDNAHEII